MRRVVKAVNPKLNGAVALQRVHLQRLRKQDTLNFAAHILLDCYEKGCFSDRQPYLIVIELKIGRSQRLYAPNSLVSRVFTVENSAGGYDAD